VSLNKQTINKQIIQKLVNNEPVFYPELAKGAKDDRYNKITKAKYWESASLTITELAEHITQGYAWMASTIDDGKPRKAENCNYTESLPIDVDNTEYQRDAQGVLVKVNGEHVKVYKKELTLEEAIAHPFIKAHAALIIPSASHTDDWHKFRIVFPLREALTSRKQIESAYKYLLEILPCGDKACKDSSRFFYGAKDKPIILINESATLPENFIFNVFDYDQEQVVKEQERLKARQYWAQQNQATDDTEQNVINALNCIPSRQIGGNTYLALRDCIWALVAHYGESKAIDIMESHSPSHASWDVALIARQYDAGRAVGLGTLFYHAKQNGFKFPANPAKGSAAPSTSKLLASKGVDTTDKKYTIDLVHLCNRRIQYVLMGDSERVTIPMIATTYKELRAWENAIAKLRPDTVPTVDINKIIDKLCRADHFNVDKVNEAIAAIDRKSALMPKCSNEYAIDLIDSWRVAFLENGSEEEKTKHDKEERVLLKARIKRLLNTNLKFNLQLNEWFEYIDGVFVLRSKDEIHGVIRHHLKLLSVADWHLRPVEIKEQTVKEYLESMKDGSRLESLDNPKFTHGLINLRDGTYDFINKELLAHNQHHGFSVQLPYKWMDAQKANASPIVKWLWESLDGQLDQVMFALCYLNAIVCRRSDLQVLLQIIGKAGAGKSTFTRLAEALIGSANVQSTKMEYLDDKFELSNFIGKPLILVNEIDSSYKGDGAILKGLTGGDRMPNRIKHHQSRGKDFVYYGKILVIANEEFKPLRVYDDWDRRNRVLKFNTVVAKKKVRNLIENMQDGSIGGDFAPHVPAFLQLVLSIPDDLVKSVLLEPEIYAPSMTDARQDTILKESSIAQWLEECVVINPDAKSYIGMAKRNSVTTTDNGRSVTSVSFEGNQNHLHPHYAQWCIDRGITAFTGFQRFSPDLLRICNGTLKLDSVKRLNRDSTGTAIAGLELRTPYHDNIPTPIKKQLIDSNGFTNETLANALIQDNAEIYSRYISVLRDFLENIDITVENNNNISTPNIILESSKSNSLNDYGSKGLQLISNRDALDSSTLRQGDTVIVDIDDIDVARVVVSQCQVMLWITPYTIDRFETIHGANMAYISNGKPVELPIGVEFLKRV
jgi:phage/plasmid-associated DNA primase